MKMEELIPGLDLVHKSSSAAVDGSNAGEESDQEDVVGPSEDLTGVVVDEDTAALELELALSKARRLNQNRSIRRHNERDLVTAAAGAADGAAESHSSDLPTSIILNSTSEFCRSLGEVPTYGLAGNRDDDEEDEMAEYDKEQSALRQGEDDDDDMTGGGAAGWQSVQIDSRPADITSRPDTAVLDDEPVVNQGLAGALLLATKKGYLDQETVRKAANMKSNIAQLAAQNYSIEDKKLEDADDKHRKRDRYIGGSSMEFREKEGYKPEVKLEYVDEAGRTMTPKEAFRYLSHRFHGKGSGKKKLEKRLKKVEEEQLMKSMSSTDTPLNTVHLLQAKQKVDKLPYIVLSGGKGIAANNIAK
jgi:U4/U6.U5 tri-snRNP-associated protein 1